MPVNDENGSDFPVEELEEIPPNGSLEPIPKGSLLFEGPELEGSGLEDDELGKALLEGKPEEEFPSPNGSLLALAFGTPLLPEFPKAGFGGDDKNPPDV